MPRPESRLVAGDSAARGGEGRVHHNGIERSRGEQKVVKPFGVDRRGLEALKRQQEPAAGMNLVRLDMASGHSSQRGNVAGAGAWFQHDHAGLDRGGPDNHQCERVRRAELLELDLLIVSPRLTGQSGHLGKEPLDCCRCIGQTWPGTTQVEIEPSFDRVISVAGMAYRGAKYLAGEIGDSGIIEMGGGIGFKQLREPKREPHSRVFDLGSRR